jgi:hypothetical protein
MLTRHACRFPDPALGSYGHPCWDIGPRDLTTLTALIHAPTRIRFSTAPTIPVPRLVSLGTEKHELAFTSPIAFFNRRFGAKRVRDGGRDDRIRVQPSLERTSPMPRVRSCGGLAGASFDRRSRHPGLQRVVDSVVTPPSRSAKCLRHKHIALRPADDPRPDPITPFR